MKPILIGIEGIECAGKTTQAQRIVERLRSNGHRVLLTREPGGTAIGEQVRTILKDPAHRATMDPITNLLLFNTSRRQFVRQVVLPALLSNTHVVTDRTYLSTLAYQGYAEGLDLELVRRVCATAMTEAVRFSKIFVLDISIEEMTRRMNLDSSRTADRYDQMDHAFHQRVRGGYLREAINNPAMEVIDGSQPSDAVTEQLILKITDLLGV